MDLILATNNQGKIREFAELFAEMEMRIFGLKDFDGLEAAEEDGTIKTCNDYYEAIGRLYRMGYRF